MSGRVVGWAAEQVTGSPITKLVLFKLADNANEMGECWPSLGLIIEHTELSRRTVQDHLAKLEELGLITIERRVGDFGQQTNIYRLAVPPPARRGKGEGAPPAPHANDAGKVGGAPPAPPVHAATKGVQDMHPPAREVHEGAHVAHSGGAPAASPIEEPPVEPSKNLSLARDGDPVGWAEVWAAFLSCWPNLPSTATEERALGAYQRMQGELPPPAEFIRLIAAQGDRLRAEAAEKRGGWATAPHNWIERDMGWRDITLALAAVETAETRMAAMRDGILVALGEDVLAGLRRAGLRQADLDRLDGTTFEAKPVPRFICARGGAYNMLSAYHQRLCDLFGAGLRIDRAGERRTG